ncbi:LamG domain-containing protein [Azospirillum palustre]|nr:LamG domain-containing protein [Azospirillum palustre]
MAGWYRQGTVALTPGSAAVAGAGTMWMGVVRPGSAFTTDGRTLYEIREVANDHTLTLDRPWEGETAGASAYAVIAASATLSNAELAGEIAAMVAKWAVREDQYDDWLGGSPNGGPNADGKYPLTDSKGVTRLVESPARLLQLLDDGVVEHAAQIIAAIEDDVATARQAATAATAAMTAVGADRQAVAQAAATVAAQIGESTAAATTATAQAAIAVHHADEAAGSAAAAAGLEASATAALAAVETARDIVLEARTEAGNAATGALSARTAAEAARDTATAARDAAQQARDAATTARTQAQDWAVKTDAPVSGSLKSALSYALDAASQATVATGKATEAAGSAAAAAASATALDTAATAAQAAAGDAATGAQTATAKASAAAISADIARSAAQQAEAAGTGSATARTAAEAARDSAATAMTAAQVAASQAGQSQTNAANSAQTSATAAADAISAKSDATAARDLAVAARTEAQGARDLAQAFAQGAVGYQPSPGVYSAFHWSEQAKGHAQTAATIVGGSNFGIVGDGASQRFVADNPGSLLNLVQAPGGKLTFSPGNHAVSFGFDAATAPVAASGNITAGTVQGALEEIDHRLSTLSQDSIANGGGSVRVTEDGAVEIAPAAGRTATYKGGELHSSATAYGKAQTDAAIAAMISAGQAAGAARLTTPRTIALSGGATGTATAFDGTQNIVIPVTAVAASVLTGTIDIARLPAGALERLYPVASDAERFALTTAQVQKGDTVQVGGTGGLMYLVVDESNLGNAAGYRAYTAARASAVDWSGVENKPALLTSLASLDNAVGVLTQTGAGTAAKRAIGTAASTDIPDRAAADGRYAQLAANNVLSGTVSILNSASAEAMHVGNGAGSKFTFVGWNESGGFGRVGAYGSSAWQNFAISEGGAPTAIGTTAMPTGGAKLNVATGIQVDNKDVWHAGNLVPGNYAAIATANTFSGKQTILGAGANLPSNTGIASAISNTAGFEIQSQGIGTPAGAAFMSFHRPGNYAVHVGLDTDNELKIGGWSMGGVAHKVWHAGNLPVSVSGNAVDFKSSPTVNGAPLATNANTVAKSTVTVLPATGSLDVPAKTILGVYSQFVGQAFNVDYNTEAQYTQENAATGTDQVGGAFQLYSTSGGSGGIDAATKLLVHADGANGSTEIIDERGITPFGSHCGWFDGSSYFTVPTSYKLAFGTAQDFTYEIYARFESLSTNPIVWDTRVNGTGNSPALIILSNGTVRIAINGSNRDTATGLLATGAFYHIVFTRRSGIAAIYVNGVSALTWAETYALPNSQIVIGQSSVAGSNTMTGWLDQFRISKTARYSTNFTPSATAFVTDADTVHLFSFDDGHGGQVLKDRSNSGQELCLEGTATISTGWSKFGASSLRMPGSSRLTTAASKPHADLNLGADNFTIDLHARFDSAGDAQVLISAGNTNQFGIQVQTSSGSLLLWMSTNGSGWDLVNGVSMGSFTVGTSAHWAIVRSGSTLYLFKDGVLQNTVSIGTMALAALTKWCFGGYVPAVGGGNMNGYVDELRIKRGVAEWVANFTVPAAPYTADDRTILLCHFDGSNGDKVTLDGSRSSYTATAFGDAALPALAFQGGAALSSAQARGGHGSALALNGSGQCASITFAQPSAGHPLYFGTNTKHCIEVWMYFASFSTSPQIFNISDASGTVANSMQLWTHTDGTLRFNGWGSGSIIPSNAAMSTGWHHIALVRDNFGWYVYVDGVKSNQLMGPQVNPAYLSAAYRLYVGAYWDGGQAFLNGAIDSIRITNGQPRYTANFTPATLVADDMTTLFWEFNGAVGQKWVKELSQNTALIAANGNARSVKDGVWIAPVVSSSATNSGISTGNAKFGSGSLYASTAGTYYIVSNGTPYAPPGDFTYDFWINPTDVSGTRRIFYKGNPANSSWDISAYLSNLTMQVEYRDTASNGFGASATLTANVWQHVAIVRSGSMITIYVGGMAKNSFSSVNGLIQQSGAFSLLDTTSSGQGMYGGTCIDEFRVSNVARWTGNFTPPSLAYGSSYVTGPFYVATLDSSRIDVSDWSTIHSATITQTTPPGTSIKWLVSFDGRATWRKWDGSAWVVVPLNSGASIDTNGNDYLTLQTALTNLNVEAYSTIDLAFSLKTANPNVSPSVDAVTLARDEYELGAAKIDYTIKRNGAAGAEIHRITNLKPYPVNVVYDYVA